MNQNIKALIDSKNSDLTCIEAKNKNPLTYAKLINQVNYTNTVLSKVGIKKNGRVAVVLDNGPAMASLFISVASCACIAPLNPAYKKEEFSFYLTDIGADCLILEKGAKSPAYEVANELRIPILQVDTKSADVAGKFEFQDYDLESESQPGVFSESEDLALILHTSGTTSKPKLVPLTNKNLITSAKNISETLKLSSNDKCLNIMPLFHIHGLIAAVLASVSAGGSIYCTEGFSALNFFSELDNSDASWYTAVPTMHQAILSRAKRNSHIIDKIRLRFIRSSSASLPPQIMKELESIFSCPIIEAYGMTEASHQMASNPLDKNTQKPGTVGLSAGPEVAILEENGSNFLSTDEIGEIVIKGGNVFRGYENNPEANKKSFMDDWFRTGDQGFIDEEGFITISGRLKEIINRGGEKISPREVDEVLMYHPNVEQVVTFSIPHDKLGEEIAAAIVLNQQGATSEEELKTYAASKLSDFKVPRKIIFLEEIPKGATGKLQRISLSKKLGLN